MNIEQGRTKIVSFGLQLLGEGLYPGVRVAGIYSSASLRNLADSSGDTGLM